MKDSFRSKHVIKCSLLFSSQRICGTCNNNFIKGIIVRQVIIYTHELTGKQRKTVKHTVTHIQKLQMRRFHTGSKTVIFRKTKHSIYLQEHQRVQETLNIHGRAVIQKYHVYFFFFNVRRYISQH